MEAKKSHSLWSARWRTRKDGGIIQSERAGLRTRIADGETPSPRPKAWELRSVGVNPGVRRPENQELWYWRAGEMDVPAWEEREQINPSSAFLFYFSPQRVGLDSTGWCPSTVARWIYTQSTDSNANLFQKHCHRHPEIMFYQLSGHPLAQSSWHINFNHQRTLFFFVANCPLYVYTTFVLSIHQ